MRPDSLILCDLYEADYEDLLALWQRAGLHVRARGRDAGEAFARQLAGGTQRAIGLRVRGEESTGASVGAAPGPLVAAAVLTHDGRKGWVNRLAVDPDWRRQGLAQALVAEAERWFASACGLEVFAALIEKENAPSRALFNQIGYQELSIIYVTKRLRPEA